MKPLASRSHILARMPAMTHSCRRYKAHSKTCAYIQGASQVVKSSSPKVIDVASGAGEPGISLAKHFTSGNILITDIAPGMVEQAKKMCANADVKNVRYRQLHMPCTCSLDLCITHIPTMHYMVGMFHCSLCWNCLKNHLLTRWCLPAQPRTGYTTPTAFLACSAAFILCPG